MLKKLGISVLATTLATASAGAWADHPQDDRSYDDRDGRAVTSDYDYAQVVDVQPIRRSVRVSEPVRECWNETRYEPDGPFSSRHIGGTLLGGLIGCVIGNEIDGGDHHTVGRVTGAIVGGAIGNNISHERQRDAYSTEQTVERCEVRYRDSWEERIDGYDVTYLYGGTRHMSRMSYDPGERIRVRVSVTPVGG